MANPEHVEVVKQGVEAIRRWRTENPGMKLELTEADLQEVSLDGADLLGVDLSRAHLAYASLRQAMLNNANLSEAQLGGANLREAYLSETNLSAAMLIATDFSEAKMRGANLAGAELGLANLSRADLTEANLYRTHLREVRGAEHARGLETVKFIQIDNPQALTTGADALYFETCRRRWAERWLDWERLRVMGRLPLFGISYTVLILIPIIFYVLALYNDTIELVRAWAAQSAALPDSPMYRFAPLVLERLHPRPIPNLSFILLVSTILLAAGSTLYTFFCPSRVKEFSRDLWCDQIGRSLLHYWPFAWKHRYIRLTCAACYTLGGAGALWVLGSKLWYAALFILKHSTFPWS